MVRERHQITAYTMRTSLQPVRLIILNDEIAEKPSVTIRDVYVYTCEESGWKVAGTTLRPGAKKGGEGSTGKRTAHKSGAAPLVWHMTGHACAVEGGAAHAIDNYVRV